MIKSQHYFLIIIIIRYGDLSSIQATHPQQDKYKQFLHSNYNNNILTIRCEIYSDDIFIMFLRLSKFKSQILETLLKLLQIAETGDQNGVTVILN